VTQSIGHLTRVDRLQRRVPAIGFPVAVAKRYGEDHGGWLGSLIAYYGFFSLYPLLVVFVTLATWVLDDRPTALQRVLEALWSKLPFVTDELSAGVNQQVQNLAGQGWVLGVSLIVALWGCIGVVRVLQDTVNTIWGVPRYRRPRFFSKLLRGLAVVGLLGIGVVGTAIVAGITVAVDLPLVAAFGAAVANIVLAGAIAIGVYHLVIGTSVRTADVLPGALITAVGVYVIALLGGLYVKHVVARMSGVYGPFASTIGLLAYVSLTVQIFVVATEVSVVRARRLWPRTLTSDLGEPDQRAIELTMGREALSAPHESSTVGGRDRDREGVRIDVGERG
jgi:YihY family inner membrane protein